MDSNWRPNQTDLMAGTVTSNGPDPNANPDWRSQLQPEARQRIVNKITDTLKRHCPVPVPEGSNEFRSIALRFEEKMYSTATSQPDYLRKISLKMLAVATSSQGPLLNPGLNPSLRNQNHIDPGVMAVTDQPISSATRSATPGTNAMNYNYNNLNYNIHYQQEIMRQMLLKQPQMQKTAAGLTGQFVMQPNGVTGGGMQVQPSQPNLLLQHYLLRQQQMQQNQMFNVQSMMNSQQQRNQNSQLQQPQQLFSQYLSQQQGNMMMQLQQHQLMQQQQQWKNQRIQPVAPLNDPMADTKPWKGANVLDSNAYQPLYMGAGAVYCHPLTKPGTYLPISSQQTLVSHPSPQIDPRGLLTDQIKNGAPLETAKSAFIPSSFLPFAPSRLIYCCIFLLVLIWVCRSGRVWETEQK